MNHIESYFDGFVARYEKALKTLPYPSEKHMGITERNLTVNFACAVEKLSKNVITWYEVPINNTQKEKNDNHLDAVILDLDKAEIFLVESKRLREKRTLDSIFKDIVRISDRKNIEKIKQRFLLEYESVFKIYGVVLFDLWTANDSSGKYKWNKIVFEKMRAGCFYKEYFEEKEDKKDKREGFEEVAHLIKNAHKNIVGYSYNLGALIFKISNLQQNYESTK